MFYVISMLMDGSSHYMKLPTIYRFLIQLLNSRKFWLRICQRGETKLKGNKILIKPHLVELKWASMGCFWEWVEGSSPVATNIELNTSQSPAPHFHTHHPWLHTIPVMERCGEKAFLMLFLHLLKSPSTIQHKLTLPPNVTTEKYRAEEARREGKRKWVWKTGDRGKITNHVTIKWIKKKTPILDNTDLFTLL